MKACMMKIHDECYARIEVYEMTLDEMEAVLAALESESVEYVVIGGAAINLHGLMRATEDLDLMLPPTPDNIERLRSALRSLWEDPSIEEIRAEDLAGDYPAIRYVPPEGEIYLDIVARFGTAFRYEDVDSQLIKVGSVMARVATPAALFRMKRNTIREVDRADARALSQRFDLEIEED
jgi:Nucleotidyl transferase AbiEii toxin, Type IV TA system